MAREVSRLSRSRIVHARRLVIASVALLLAGLLLIAGITR
jgi:hypothetical protein